MISEYLAESSKLALQQNSSSLSLWFAYRVFTRANALFPIAEKKLKFSQIRLGYETDLEQAERRVCLKA